MKKVLAREFLWFIGALVLSIPLAFLFLWMLGLTAETTIYTQDEEVFATKLFFLGYILSFIGIYLTRIVYASIKLILTGEDDLAVPEE
ncbi:MAG: hypothetical protein ACPGVB_00205 [Chitinophagales bacterium]